MVQTLIDERNRQKKRLELALETYGESLKLMNVTMQEWNRQIEIMNSVIRGIKNKL